MTERVVATGRRVSRPRITRDEMTLPLDAWGDENYTVTALDMNDIANPTGIRDTLLPYVSKLKSNIVFWNNHGSRSVRAVPEEDIFKVVFWSTPIAINHRSTEYKYHNVFGYPMMSGQDDGYYFVADEAEQGDVIRDGGQEVAILLDNTLHILWDLPHSNNNVHEVLSAIMDEVLKIKGDPGMTKEEREKAKLEEVVRKVVGARLNIALERNKAYISQHVQTIDSYQREIISSAGKLASLKRDIASQEAEIAKLSAGGIVESIKRIPGVESVGPHRNNLRVVTESILIDTSVARYEMGRYNIDYTSTGSYSITAVDRNHVEKISGADHPHVNGGKPCLGNVSEITINVASGELDIATALIIDFLKSFTPGGAFVSIDRWPKVANIRSGKVTMLKTPVRDWDHDGDNDEDEEGDDD